MPIERQSQDPKLRKFVCALCAQPLTDSNASKEHVIPNAIGGRKTVSNFICRNCNSLTGHDWDYELINQLKPLCTILNIKRGHGSNQHITVETFNSGELDLNPDGSMTRKKPECSERNLGGKTEIEIRARCAKKLKEMISGLKKEYPQIEIDELMENATEIRGNIGDVFRIDLCLVGGDFA